MRAKSRIHGFTLIEIMISMSIISILIALSLTAYAAAKKSSRDGKRKADIEQIRAALEMYRADDVNGRYPSSLSSLTPDYIKTLPEDPVSGYNYKYNRLITTTYCLCAYLESSSGGSACNCGGNCGTAGACNYYTQNP